MPAGAAMIRAAAEFEHQLLEFQRSMTTLVSALDISPWEQLAQHLREISQQWSCMACGTTWHGLPDHVCTWTPLDPAAEHRMRVQLLKAYKVRPHEIGIPDMGCACHSAPFPAGWDYHRRTKHRNRRRR